MDPLDELEKCVLDALKHLHSANYRPPVCLSAALACDPREGAVAVQSAMLTLIDSLRSAPETPHGAYSRRLYDVLRCRFLERLTLEETAESLNLSIRHVTRMQRDAVHTLVRALWARGTLGASATGYPSASPEGMQTPPADTPDWHSQARAELASLETSSPDLVADVEEVLNGLLGLEAALASAYRVKLKVEFIQPGLVAAVHPSVLRQVLVTAIARLAAYTTQKSISIFAMLEDRHVKITATCAIFGENKPRPHDLCRGIVLPDNVLIETDTQGEQFFLRIRAFSVGQTVVLVIDDNPEMAHLYRRSAIGTRYRIVHVRQGLRALEAVHACVPDAIVLDILLPDVDGWRLLSELRQDEVARSVPIVVCSVVREIDLARSLGAALCLTKPVRPHDFIRALDQALSRA